MEDEIAFYPERLDQISNFQEGRLKRFGVPVLTHPDVTMTIRRDFLREVRAANTDAIRMALPRIRIESHDSVAAREQGAAKIFRYRERRIPFLNVLHIPVSDAENNSLQNFGANLNATLKHMSTRSVAAGFEKPLEWSDHDLGRFG
ncbi:MAG: hypothetical protein V4801_02510 [Burkholderia gladioli]